MEERFTSEQYNKLLEAFNDDHMTNASQIVIGQVYRSKGIENYKGKNPFEFAKSITDEHWALDLKSDYTIKDVKNAADAFYAVIEMVVSDSAKEEPTL